MYILNNKSKFISPIHQKGKLNLLFIGLFLAFFVFIYIKDYMAAVSYFTMALFLKSYSMMSELTKVKESNEYLNWMNFYKSKFIQKSMKYIITLFYISSCYIIFYLMYRYYVNDMVLIKIVNTIVVIFLMFIIYDFSKNLIKMKM